MSVWEQDNMWCLWDLTIKKNVRKRTQKRGVFLHPTLSYKNMKFCQKNRHILSETFVFPLEIYILQKSSVGNIYSCKNILIKRGRGVHERSL